MKHRNQVAFIPWRFYLVISFIVIFVAGLIVRMVDLAVINRHFLNHQGDVRVLREVSTPAFRGIITDRNNYPLAISTSVYSVWINPQEFSNTPANLKKLSQLVGIKSSAIKTAVQRYKDKNREFLYVKREVAPDIAQKVKNLLIPGVYLQQEYKRYYPEGEIAAHVVGFTNIDDQGQEGLELAYNEWLSGTPGKKWVIKDRLGRAISNVRSVQEQRSGKDLQLSIDRRIQYLAYRELLDGVQKNNAKSGSLVVLDIKTGEILAMVNQPSFNPNNHSGQKQEYFRNRAITDIFEPGSTIKAFSVATALDSGRYKANTLVNTAPGWMRVGRHLVQDEHNNGALTVTQILQLSSNVGVSKMILSLPSNRLWDLLHRMGFGEVTGVGFPGEQSGVLQPRKTWDPFILSTLSFGYGISVTPLQLAHAYATIANDGVKIPVSLLRVHEVPQGERAMNAKAARAMLNLLESVTAKGGTGEFAQIPGFKVAGKTGTARMVGPNGYEKKHHISSFVGIAPASHPRLVVAVVVNDPQGKKYHGGTVAAPVFEKVMEGALRILNVAPDLQQK